MAPDRHRTLAPAGAAAGARTGRADALPGHAAGGLSRAPAPAASLWLRLPDGEPPVGGPVSVTVTPGARTTLIGLVRNESGIVDNYDLAVRGLPEGWWSVSPATAYLVPLGADGPYEQEFEVHLHPPRHPEARARAWNLEVVASSRAYDRTVADAPATMRIEAYQDLAAKLAPDRAGGRLKARFALTLRNRANAPVTVALAAEDADDECRFRFAQPTVSIEPGGGLQAPLRVLPRRQIWIGRAKDRSIRVTATPAPSDGPAVPLTATYRQRPWLPWWFSLALPLAAALAAAVMFLLPKHVVVPDLRHAQSVFAAEKLAIAAGLTLSPDVKSITTSSAAPGAIVDQAPAPGSKAKPGAQVIVRVAVGTEMTAVPKLMGSTPVTADSTLRRQHLVLGEVSPQPPNPNGQIASQIPAAGSRVRQGTPVQVFIKAPGTTAKPPASDHTGTKSNGPTTPAHAVAVPALAGSELAFAQHLSQLGLVPSVVTRFSPQPAGQLIGTNPSTGTSITPGSTVQLVVSAGYPRLSYDTASDGVRVVNGGTGVPAGASPSGAGNEEATWSPGGDTMVYVSGPPNAGQLMLFAAGQADAKPTPLTAPGSQERDPAISPDGKVLAFIDRSQGVGRLCLAVLSDVTPLNTQNCVAHNGYDLGRQVSWSHDGKAILVFGVRVGHPSEYGLIEFQSIHAFAPSIQSWDPGTLITHPAQDVIAGEFSPVGRQVAFVASLGQSDFHVFIAAAHTFDPGKATELAIEGCQVAWRSDGQALAVMISTGGCGVDATGNYPPGFVATLTLSDPDHPTIVASAAANPAWQPLSIGR